MISLFFFYKAFMCFHAMSFTTVCRRINSEDFLSWSWIIARLSVAEIVDKSFLSFCSIPVQGGSPVGWTIHLHLLQDEAPDCDGSNGRGYCGEQQKAGELYCSKRLCSMPTYVAE
jgi:hypothetical protein